MATSIPISGLNLASTVDNEDFIPIVQSSSLTTYRITIQSFQEYIGQSGSVITSSWSSASLFSSNSSSSFFASSSNFSISSSWSSASMYSTSASFASRSLVSISSSWASASFSSSYAVSSSHSVSASWSPSQGEQISASWASQSFFATSASWSSQSFSSSYAVSSSQAVSSSISEFANVIKSTNPFVTRYFNNLGASWIFAKPFNAFVDGDDMYVINSDWSPARTAIRKLNMQTNVVTHQVQLTNDHEIKLKAFDVAGTTHVIMKSYQGNPNGRTVDYNLSTPTVAPVVLDSTLRRYERPIIADYSVYPNNPTIWAVLEGYNGSSFPDTNTVLTKYEWDGLNYNYTYNSGPGNLDFRLVANSTEFLKFFDQAGGYLNYTRQIVMWDYNPIKKRHYLMEYGNGNLHIFTHTVGSPNDGANWLGTSLTYEKTLSIPVPSNDQQENNDYDNNVINVDYDLITGDEFGLIIVRGGPYTLLGGITYVNWPEYNNW